MNSRNVKRFIGVVVVGVVMIGLVGGLSGCQNNKHELRTTASESEYHTLDCKLCYDEVVRVKRSLSPGKPVPASYKVYRKHQCPSCSADAEIYSEDGQLMLKCDGCAPEGKPCDKCLPPEEPQVNLDKALPFAKL